MGDLEQPLLPLAGENGAGVHPGGDDHPPRRTLDICYRLPDKSQKVVTFNQNPLNFHDKGVLSEWMIISIGDENVESKENEEKDQALMKAISILRLVDEDNPPDPCTLTIKMAFAKDMTGKARVRAWFTDDVSQERSPQQVLGMSTNEATLNVPQHYQPNHTRWQQDLYQWLVIGFDQDYTLEAAENQFVESELGQLKFNLRDLILHEFNNPGKTQEVPVKFHREGVTIKGNLLLSICGAAKPIENTAQTSFDDCLAKLDKRKEWLNNIGVLSDNLPGLFLGFNLHFKKRLDRSTEISSAAVAALPRVPWGRGKTENLVAGPAVAQALRGLLAMLILYTFFSLLFGMILLPSCGSLGERHIVLVPMLPYILFAAFALLKLRSEVSMMGCVLPGRVLVAGLPNYSLPSYFEVAGKRFNMPWADGKPTEEKNYRPPSYYMLPFYLAYKIAGSLAGSFDLFSSSLFLARIWATRVIHQNRWDIEAVWQVTLRHSSLKPIFDVVGYPSFLRITICSWLTVILQVMYSLAYSWPTSGELQYSSRPKQEVCYDFREPKDVIEKEITHPENYRSGAVKRRCVVLRQLFPIRQETILTPKHPKDTTCSVAVADFATYQTIVCDEQTHRGALSAIAKSGRMTMVQAMEPEYTKECMQHWPAHEVLYFQKQTGRAFRVFMLQKVFNTSIQASLVGISANLAKAYGNNASGADTVTFLSVVLSAATGMIAVFSQVKQSRSLYNKISKDAGARKKHEGLSKSQANVEDQILRSTWIEFWIFGNLSILGCLFVFLWCFVKVMLAEYVCPCGMSNFKLPAVWPPNWFDPAMSSSLGCVVFDLNTSDWVNNTGEECVASGHHMHEIFQDIVQHQPKYLNLTDYLDISDSWCHYLLLHSG